MLIQQTLHRTS